MALALVMGASALSAQTTGAGGDAPYVVATEGVGRFRLASIGRAAAVYVSPQDYPGVARAANDLRSDIARISGAAPALLIDVGPGAREVVLVGTLGRSPLIDRLVREKKLDVTRVVGRWETFVIQVIDKPPPNVARALVIAGSDKRGTIYGASHSSTVRPWYSSSSDPVPASRESSPRRLCA